MKQLLKFGVNGCERIRIGMTSKRFAVVGDPISHSLSPIIHSAAYEHLNLDWDYTKYRVVKDDLRNFLSGQGSGLSGVSVTMPLKSEAAELSDSKDEIVALLGVANTLVSSGSSWKSFNTDVFGIQKSLANAWAEGVYKVAILGAGATAQSALYAVRLSAPNATVSVYVRNVGNTKQIVALAEKLNIQLNIKGLAEYSHDQDLTVSTVPAEALVDLPLLKQTGWLLNVIYSSFNDAFSGCFDAGRVVSGEQMLIWQAIAQIRLFLNGDAANPIVDEPSLYVKMLAAL
jgi:shikimate dehydrogenase